MNDDKTERWGMFLKSSGVEYDAEHNLVDEWVTYVMHTKLNNLERREVLRACTNDPAMRAAIGAVRRLMDRERRGFAMLDLVRDVSVHA